MHFLLFVSKKHCLRLMKLINDSPNYGVFFVLAGDTLLDLNAEIKNSSSAKINVVSGNDAGVQLSNRKAYRVLVRPTLSRQTM